MSTLDFIDADIERLEQLIINYEKIKQDANTKIRKYQKRIRKLQKQR